MPQFGFEAAGSMVEKFLPGVNFPILLNAILPGAMAAVALFPRVAVSIPAIFSQEIEKIWPKLVLYAVVVVALGGLISSLNSEFYKIYEGRTFWPAWFKKWAVAQQQKRVESLYAKADATKGVKEKEQEYNETWYKLRVYPINTDGRRYANYPTLMGNILFGYEDYPKDRYGMDSIFYWPRLWLTISKDNREEISKSWSVADGLLNLSAVSLLAGAIWAVETTAYAVGFHTARYVPITNRVGMSYLAVLGWLAVAYFFYRLSLPFHRNNGEVFKSLFDLYRGGVLGMTDLSPGEAERWRAAWAYLQYLRIRCPQCNQGYVSVYDTKCPNCGHVVSEIVEQVRKSGHLVAEVTPPADTKSWRDSLRSFFDAFAAKPPKP
ncbi:MAG: hypothetical protein WBS19_07600 [Candidatus Korobacteraceae bacterium]